jgi:hypothetical protein
MIYWVDGLDSHLPQFAAVPGPVVRTAMYGMACGAGAGLFGLGIGWIALGFGIILGTACSLGVLVP